MTEQDYPDDFPTEVWVADANHVELAMKELTAQRMVGWLRGYADYCDVAGHDKSAEHARNVANRLAKRVDPEKVERDTPTDRLDKRHHNAPKDGNDDPEGI